MTPKEAFDFIKSASAFPPGINPKLDKDRIIIGNEHAHFVLSGDLILNEEIIILTVNKSLPSLQEAIKQSFEEKKAAAELDAKLKKDLNQKIRRKK